MIRPAVAIASAVLALLPAAARAGEAPAGLAAQLEALAPTVVTVKFVLKTRMSFGGQSRDDESNSEARGVVLDPSGLVMLANSSLEAGHGLFRRMRQGMEVSASPADFKVLVGTDPKEHAAVLVARDSKLGLAFVQLLSVEGLTLSAARLAAPARPPEVGQTLFGVSRLGAGFDYAPTVATLAVTGKVEKPRAMWSVAGDFAQVGLPVYDAAGQAVGVLAQQEGAEGASSGGGGPMGISFSLDGSTFLLPLDAVGKSVDAAKKRAPEALAKARDGAAAAAETDPKPEGAPTTGPDAPKAPDAPKVPEAPDAPK